jgi:hypothetical protein
MHSPRLALFAVALLAACTSSTSGSTGPSGDPVVITATAGTTPTYLWTGASAVRISVARMSALTTEVWGVSSQTSGHILPGTKHGMVPSGATQTAMMEPALTAGVRYRVAVTLTDGRAGSLDFTP